MTSRQRFRARRAAALCALSSVCAVTSASAEDEREEQEAAPSQGSKDAPADTDERSAEAATRNNLDAEVGSAAADGLAVAAVSIERLPPAAYPEPRVRGVVGGSLWLNMHGLQWPYMPGQQPGVAGTRIGFSGYGWVDTSYRDVDSGLPDDDPSLKEWRQQSRFLLRATPTHNADGGWFVQGQGEIVLNGQAPTRTEEDIVADDLYVRIGKWNLFDITAGRFQGWEVYHLGMGLDLFTVERDGALTDNNDNRPVDFYGLTYFWDRPNGPGRVAAHYYPTDYLRFELLGQVGSSGLNVLGVRPVGILDVGLVKVKLGAEYGNETARQQSAVSRDRVERRGVAGSVQLVLEPRLEAGAAFAHALVDTWNAQGTFDPGRSTTTTSYGGFASLRVIDPVILGAGGTYTQENNLNLDVTGRLNDERSHLQLFGAAQYALWNQLFLKLVVAHANAHFNPLSETPPIVEVRNKSLSARLRLFYLF